jgi:uncharacterized protein YacL
MQKEPGSILFRSIVVLIAVLINTIVLKIGFTNNDKWYWALFITIPALLIAIGMNKPHKKGILISSVSSKEIQRLNFNDN